MGDRTGIQWTDATWNPVRGCSRVSEGCRHCYAERIAARFSGSGQPYEGLAVMRNGEPRWTGEVKLIEAHLRYPLQWRKSRRIFVNSMSDLFHEKLDDAAIDRVFAVMILASHHVYQILTKRPERMRAYLSHPNRCAAWTDEIHKMRERPSWFGSLVPGWWPGGGNHIWLGVSAENQQAADERVPFLLSTPAVVRFVSAEPLLGPIDFARSGKPDWIIVGGESGPGARSMRPMWAQQIRDYCREAGVAFFFKQWGGKTTPDHGALLDGREWHGFPTPEAR